MAVHAACTKGPTGHWGHDTRTVAHPKHEEHVRDARRVPARDVLIEGVQAGEQFSHVCDRRDDPDGGRAVRAEGCSLVVDPHLDRRLQGGLGRKRVRAVTRDPTRTVFRVKGRFARPGATDEHPVCIGQRRALPSHIEAHEESDKGGEARGCWGRGWGGQRARRNMYWSWGTACARGMRTSKRLCMPERVYGTPCDVNSTSVTPDVSKLSGWSNADACCRGTLEAHEEGDTGGGRARRRRCVGAEAVHAACARRNRLGTWHGTREGEGGAR